MPATSPTLSPTLPLTSPGLGTGNHRQVYLKVDFLYSKYLDMWHHGHLMDSMAGTHLVPPAYALPDTNEPVDYEPEVRGWLEQYEKKYGKRGSSKLTADKVPLEWACGEARVIDVRGLSGTTKRRDWPASPEITVEHIKTGISQIDDYTGGFTPGDYTLIAARPSVGKTAYGCTLAFNFAERGRSVYVWYRVCTTSALFTATSGTRRVRARAVAAAAPAAELVPLVSEQWSKTIAWVIGPEVATHNCESQDHSLDKALDLKLIEQARPALEEGKPVQIETTIRNYNRTFGAMLSSISGSGRIPLLRRSAFPTPTAFPCPRG